MREAPVEAGLLRESTFAPPTRGGKPGKKSVRQLGLTETGERLLRESGRPEVAGSGALAGLRQGLEEDRRALRERVLAALPAKGKGADGKLAQEVGRLSKAVSDLAARLVRLEGTSLARGITDGLWEGAPHAGIEMGCSRRQGQRRRLGAQQPAQEVQQRAAQAAAPGSRRQAAWAAKGAK